MKKMLFFLIFFLTCVSNLVPTTLSSHVTVTQTESPVAPVPSSKYAKTSATSSNNSVAPVKVLNISTIVNQFDEKDPPALFVHTNEKIRSLSTAHSTYFSGQSGITPDESEGRLEKMTKEFQVHKPAIVNPESTSTHAVPDRRPTTALENDGETSALVLKLDRDYTPREIAEYIFVTGDEREFAQGIAEMVEDGEIMISKDDVILFLEAVQRELANLRGESDHNDEGDGEDDVGNNGIRENDRKRR